MNIDLCNFLVFAKRNFLNAKLGVFYQITSSLLEDHCPTEILVQVVAGAVLGCAVAYLMKNFS